VLPSIDRRSNLGGKVLDFYIIEEIKKQEQERQSRDEARRPRLEIHIPRRSDSESERAPDEEVDEDGEPIRIRII
jgi:hypothetical protein